MKYFLLPLMLMLLLAGRALAGEPLVLDGDFVQGGLVHGKVPPGSKVRIGMREVRLTDEGGFVFGFGRDITDPVTVNVDLPGGQSLSRTVKVAARKYNIERVDGLEPSKVSPGPEFLKRIKRENAEIARIRAIDSPAPRYLAGWIWPAIGRVSGVYGSQRVLNGQPKRPHYGLDVAGPVGTPVVAPSDGVVKMVEPDLYYTGGTIMIDHGHGLVSVFSHLSKSHVKVGEPVQKGDLIGAIGKTGRSSGPHLDWRVNWFSERLDPQLLVGPMPKPRPPKG